jgi:hypothetical protein
MMRLHREYAKMQEMRKRSRKKEPDMNPSSISDRD